MFIFFIQYSSMVNSQSIEDTNQNTVISISNLYKSFGETKVLQGIDIDVNKGENVIVLGQSGSGKSVLFKMITGFLQPDEGTVTVMGNDVASLSKGNLMKLRKQIGLSFQNSALYDSMTIWENIEFALTRHFKKISETEVETRIMSMLKTVGLEHTYKNMPADLSGGQKKRIGIARALVLEPDIMLYDEPTAGLDPVTSGEINELINHVQEKFKTTSLIITHDLTCAKKTGNRLFMMHKGRFIRQGSFDEIFSANDERIMPFFNYNFIQ